MTCIEKTTYKAISGKTPYSWREKTKYRTGKAQIGAEPASQEA